jgi:hypothetical protein
MKLKEKFKEVLINPIWQMTMIDKQMEIAEDFAIDFTKWKDDNFHRYRDERYYASTSSSYFDITKYVGKEKATKYYTLKELMNLYKETL